VDAIVTESLSKTYGRGRRLPIRPQTPVRALDALTISVHEGEIFGFLGPNGAGKSTTIRLLLGFLHPTLGTARVLGRDAATDGLEIRRHIGYLPGGIALYDSMTGEDLLAYLADLYGAGAPLRDHLVERLEFTGTDLRRPIRDYSRGMRQKLGIIQALQHNPELAILDEPTEGLDPLMQRAFYEILDELRKSGRTVFLSSHILSEVERVCDRVAIIRAGSLVALSNVEELLARRRRHVEIRYEGTPPALEGIPGISDVHVRAGLVTCQLEGDVRPFLAAIHDAQVADLLIEPARLEEAFLEFYSDQPAGHAAGPPA
jgi:ABC-2 type transport system ATP-binding protein